ncbi:MAG: hypothetical protein Q7T80_02460 [Methanoregula sp.]|nr:hypothetical protein [Methanoregula sp.]
MTGIHPRIFSRHDRQYCLFAVPGRDEEFLYYSHRSLPLRSLMTGRDFTARVSRLMENGAVCIECGLGSSVTGSVAFDNGDCIAWQCPVEEANRVLTDLKSRLGAEGQWIELF